MSESTKAEAVLRARATYPGPPLDPLDDAIRVVLAEINRLREHNKKISEQTREEAWAEINRLQSELAAAKERVINAMLDPEIDPHV